MAMIRTAAIAGKMTKKVIASVVMLGVVWVVGRREGINALDKFHPLGEAVARLHEANYCGLADPPLNHLPAINEANKPINGGSFSD
jgi:hypothetical protein